MPDYSSSSFDAGVVPLLQKWVRSRIGQSVDLQDLFLGEPPWQDVRSPDYNLGSVRLPVHESNLPDETVIRDLMRWYRSLPACRSFPVINASLLDETMKLAYDCSPNPPRGSASARACLWGFVASVGMWKHDSASLAIDGQPTILQAARLLPQVLREETLDGLQALVMLVCIFSTIETCSGYRFP